MMSTKSLFCGLSALIVLCFVQDAPGQAAGQQQQYRVNYRPSDHDPWQLYAPARTLDKANAIASEVRQSGYQAAVVSAATPTPQPYPDAAETSASNYYPTSNWANDYNYYSVPGGSGSGSGYGYNWYGGWNPWNRHHLYSNYASAGGSGWNSGWYGGHGWNSGWNRGYAGGGWSGSHRNWNNNHAGRGSHYSHHERHSSHAHHGYAGHRATTGHHSAGHHAAASHSSHHSSEHRGTGHFANGGRNGGHNAHSHSAGGHSFHGGGGRHGGTGGRHAGGQHAHHLDP
ncbi:MAG: hypothetical protein P4L84_33770 [Isosphaeraceae bacterium]|nr:hypothetical protein [Isosphaeraceae bacterium]